MTDERKDQIGKEFIFQEKISIDELNLLDIQEIAFLIFSAKHFEDEKAFPNINFDQKIQIFTEVLNDKIKSAKDLFIVYDTNTEYPYLDDEGRSWIFSEEEYANKAVDYYNEQLIMLKAEKIPVDDRLKFFSLFHILGIEKLLMDNGQYAITVNRNDLLPPSNYSETPTINIPVTNSKLQHAIIRFFQMLYTKYDFANKNRTLSQLEGNMFEEVINAKYLVPMQLKETTPSIPDEQGVVTLKEGTTISFANLVAPDESVWLPAFTDWNEFEKAYDKTIWQSNITTYNDLLALSKNIEGIVINCKGIPLHINDKNKRLIDEYLNTKRNPKATSIQNVTVEKDTKILLGEPKNYPSKMIDAVKSHMKNQRAIKKAYLRLMVRDNEESYLIIVDHDGEKDSIFQGIADAATPYLEGIYLDMVGADFLEKHDLKDLTPFYKKKLFGIF